MLHVYDIHISIMGKPWWY